VPRCAVLAAASLICALAATAASVGMAAAATPKGPTNRHVSFDSQSLFINHHRVMLNFAEVEYFRMPSPRQWPGVLAALKADGFNAIDTYVPWAYHEPAPGVFRFSGRYDLGQFLADAAHAGLYVQVRPGPNQTGGIDGGGTPSWVMGRPGYLRTNDPNYTRLWKQWFRAVVPQIRPYQIGGPKHGSVVLFMVENEYPARGDGPTKYADDLYTTVRNLGITVPITANDFADQPQLPLEHRVDLYGFDQYPLLCSTPCPLNKFGSPWGTSTFSNTRALAVSIDHDESYFRAAGVTRTPLFATETSGGIWPSQLGYGGKTATSLQRYLSGYTTASYFSLLGQGVTALQPWVAFGGESWGYLPSLEFASSYDWLSPVGPTGAPGPRFAEARLAGMQMQADASSLANSSLDSSDVAATNPAVLYRVRRSRSDGALHIFLRNADPGPAASTALSIDGTRTPAVAVPGHSALYLLAHAKLSGWHLRWSTASVLQATTRYLVLFGQKGRRYAAVLNARRISFTPNRPRTMRFPHGRTLVIVDRQDAAQTWVTGKQVLVGPALITGSGMQTTGPTTETTISGNRISRQRLAGPPGARALGLPGLRRGWRFAPEAPERLPSYSDRGWTTAGQQTTTVTAVQPLTKPVLYADNYGAATGFVWYRGTFSGSAAGLCVEGRTVYHVWINGHSLGTVRSAADFQSQNPVGGGPPADEQVELRFPRGTVHPGRNEISVLTDDQGHSMDVAALSWAKTPRGLWSAAIDRGSGVSCGHFLSGVPQASGVVPSQGPVPNGHDGGITWKLRGGALGGFPNASGLLGERQGWYRPGFDDSRWKRVSLPDGGRLSPGQVGWYRTRFSLNIPACVQAGLRIALPASSVTGELYLNGVNIGQPGRDVAGSYVLPPGLVNPHGQNTLAIARWAIDGTRMPAPRLIGGPLARTCRF
jgi:hypothetical protein